VSQAFAEKQREVEFVPRVRAVARHEVKRIDDF